MAGPFWRMGGLAGLAGLCALVVCGHAAFAAPPVAVSGAWARATLPHQDEGVAYLALRSAVADALVGADSPEAGMAMLHRSTKAGGMAGMEDVDRVALPAGQAVVLAPNGTHIMLMDLKHPLRAGDVLHLTLRFAHAPSQDVAVPVRPIGATGP